MVTLACVPSGPLSCVDLTQYWWPHRQLLLSLSYSSGEPSSGRSGEKVLRRYGFLYYYCACIPVSTCTCCILQTSYHHNRWTRNKNTFKERVIVPYTGMQRSQKPSIQGFNNRGIVCLFFVCRRSNVLPPPVQQLECHSQRRSLFGTSKTYELCTSIYLLHCVIMVML